MCNDLQVALMPLGNLSRAIVQPQAEPRATDVIKSPRVGPFVQYKQVTHAEIMAIPFKWMDGGWMLLYVQARE